MLSDTILGPVRAMVKRVEVRWWLWRERRAWRTLSRSWRHITPQQRHKRPAKSEAYKHIAFIAVPPRCRAELQ